MQYIKEYSIEGIIKRVVLSLDRYINKKYVVDGFDLYVGRNHRLKSAQKLFPMYDRFLPYLASLNNSENGWIIDIGANVGDTTLGMLKHMRGGIISVEPADEFYGLLEQNIGMLDEKFKKRIILKHVLIADDTTRNYTIDISKGTGKRKENSKSITPIYTIPQLIDECGVQIKDIKIIKSDTDGYDADCILSMGNLLSIYSPILYWENSMENQQQYNRVKEMNNYLYESGYTTCFVFDQYGNYLVHGELKSTLDEIDDYLRRNVLVRSSRVTFSYVDVLACKKEDEKKCIETVRKYETYYGMK